jgi:hypothetical protein
LRSDARGDYILSGRLYDFREIDGNGLAARVAFEFELRESKSGTTVWSRLLPRRTGRRRRHTAVVAALNRNVQSGLREVTGGLDQYFSSQAHTTAAGR